MKSTALIILNFNNYIDTINCIESVEKYNSAPIKIIVVDNASSAPGASEALRDYLIGRYKDQLGVYYNDTVKDVKSDCNLSYCSLILSKINDGYARGNNKGLLLAEKDSSIEYIMILNNDVLFVQDIIPSLVERSEAIPDSALLSPLLYKRNMDGYDYNCARNDTTFMMELAYNFFQHIYWLLKCDNPFIKSRFVLKSYKEIPTRIPIELPSGSCMFIKKELFKQIDYFDPNTFLYNEENILYRKVKRINRQNYLFSDLKCIHLGAQSTSKVPYSYKDMKRNVSSTVYYMTKYYGLNTAQKVIYLFSVYFSILIQRIKFFFK